MCVDYSKITKKLRFVDQVVMELWVSHSPIYDSA